MRLNFLSNFLLQVQWHTWLLKQAASVLEGIG